MRRHVVIVFLCVAWAAMLLAGCDTLPPSVAASKESDPPLADTSDSVETVEDGAPLDTDTGGEAGVMFSTLVADADDDGVEDEVDACPGTPAGQAVDEVGCSCAQIDTDGDGANDCDDECPDNPYRTEAGAEIAFAVSFDDPEMEYADYYADIEALLLAVGEDWAQHLLAPRNVTIEILIQFADIPTATAASATVVFVGNNGVYNVYEQGVAAEIGTGIDPNGVEPDATVRIGIGNLTGGRWWFDPDPASRSVPVPGDRIDAYSTLLHEMGHVLAYNGWRNAYTGELRSDFQSTYDEMTVFDGEDFFFIGEAAMDVYGGPVAETYGNCRHLGNRAPRPGSDLLDQLMNGVANRRGWRRFISELDLAILADVGLPVRGPDTDVDGCGGSTVTTQTYRRQSPRLGPPPVLQD